MKVVIKVLKKGLEVYLLNQEVSDECGVRAGELPERHSMAPSGERGPNAPSGKKAKWLCWEASP